MQRRDSVISNRSSVVSLQLDDLDLSLESPDRTEPYPPRPRKMSTNLRIQTHFSGSNTPTQKRTSSCFSRDDTIVLDLRSIDLEFDASTLESCATTPAFEKNSQVTPNSAFLPERVTSRLRNQAPITIPPRTPLSSRSVSHLSDFVFPARTSSKGGEGGNNSLMVPAGNLGSNQHGVGMARTLSDAAAASSSADCSADPSSDEARRKIPAVEKIIIPTRTTSSNYRVMSWT
ncbi:hypothetical protein BJ741DRAFT_593596 [Chytriomyces cf. hyalinus JEL632]|nr:hypothetical protein BJ741DRAFT_593596 [Chytriomyces cf. hyalinus JEL632]